MKKNSNYYATETKEVKNLKRKETLIAGKFWGKQNILSVFMKRSTSKRTSLNNKKTQISGKIQIIRRKYEGLKNSLNNAKNSHSAFVIKNIQNWKSTKNLLQFKLFKKILNFSVLVEKIQKIDKLYNEETTRLSDELLKLEKTLEEAEDKLINQMNSDWASNHIYEEMQKPTSINKTSVEKK